VAHQKIERDATARGVFISVPDLERRLMRYIRQCDTQPKPVKWKYFDHSRRMTRHVPGRRLFVVAQLCYITFFTWSFAMSTTTIRLPQELKERIARAAERAGTTAHSFILEAIAEKAEQEERRGEFQNTAERRYAEIVASGKTVPWTEMRRYLERRLTSNKIARPKPRTLAR
jgi:predicted transcriptional regulator